MHSSRTNFPSEIEQAINHLIESCWGVERTYTALSAQCSGELRLDGFRDYFTLCGLRSRSIAEKLLEFQTIRGGIVILNDIQPSVQLPNDVSVGMYKFFEIALESERKLERLFHELYHMASSKSDIVTKEFVERHFLTYQAHMIKSTVTHMQDLKSSTNQWVFDRLAMRPTVQHIVANLSSLKVSRFVQALLWSNLSEWEHFKPTKSDLDSEIITDNFNCPVNFMNYQI